LGLTRPFVRERRNRIAVSRTLGQDEHAGKKSREQLTGGGIYLKGRNETYYNDGQGGSSCGET